jgi:hypothetical protein
MVFTGDFGDDLANTMNSESNRRQAMRSVITCDPLRSNI